MKNSFVVAILNMQFRCMKQSDYFINISRGELIDEDALVRASRDAVALLPQLIIRDEQTGGTTNQLIRACEELHGRLLVAPHTAGISWGSMAKAENFIISKVMNECSNNAYL